ncbi:hypothetical protein C2E23DRAFT_860755 [Lenzites betulinus]|nr:hypothetical protein C2E23DRAFT_860755 [Lenzites betulinus]
MAFANCSAISEGHAVVVCQISNSNTRFTACTARGTSQRRSRQRYQAQWGWPKGRRQQLKHAHQTGLPYCRTTPCLRAFTFSLLAPTHDSRSFISTGTPLGPRGNSENLSHSGWLLGDHLVPTMPVLQVAGEPRPSTKPEPLGNAPLVILFTTCTLCALFLLWRRAHALRSVVAHPLRSWPQTDGRIRLSLDEGPSAREFLDDDYDEDHTGLGDDEPIAVTAGRLQKAASTAEDRELEPTLLFSTEADEDEPPPPPPKASPPPPPSKT